MLMDIDISIDDVGPLELLNSVIKKFGTEKEKFYHKLIKERDFIKLTDIMSANKDIIPCRMKPSDNKTRRSQAHKKR